MKIIQVCSFHSPSIMTNSVSLFKISLRSEDMDSQIKTRQQEWKLGKISCIEEIATHSMRDSIMVSSGSLLLGKILTHIYTQANLQR